MIVVLFVLLSLHFQTTEIQVSNVSRVREMQRLDFTPDYANVLLFDPLNDERLYFGLSNGQIAVYDLADGSHRSWQAHPEPVVDLAISSDGEQLFSASSDGCVFKWNSSTHTRLQQIGDCGQAVTAIALNRSDELLAVGYDNGEVYLFNIESGDRISSFYTLGSSIDLKFHFPIPGVGAETLVVADAYSVWLYRVENERLQLMRVAQEETVQTISGIDVHPSDRWGPLPAVAVKISVVQPQLWHFYGIGRAVFTFERSEMTYANALDFDREGDLLAVAGKFTTAGGGCDAIRCAIEIFHTGEGGAYDPDPWGERLVVLDGHTTWHTDVEFSPSNRYLVSSSVDGLVILWGLPSES
jgi:WD40 repeat protein